MNIETKKYWKVLNSPDIKKCLEKLNAPNDYIEILLEEDSDFDKYIKKNSKYVFICQDPQFFLNFEGFGWGEEKDEPFFIEYNYKYTGIINLRKEKLQILKTISIATQSELCSDKNEIQL